jgi:Zn-finger nucleic acid-binding protein
VDRCTACGGIWFDAGEAESLLDRSPSALQGFFGDLLKGIGGGKPTS